MYSHWNQKASKNLIGLCALTLFSFSPVPYFFLSPLYMHVYACVLAITHTHIWTLWHTTKFVLPPTSKLAPALLMHTHTCIHTSITIICMQSGWLWWVAMVAVTRLCDKKQQVALLLICANVKVSVWGHVGRLRRQWHNTSQHTVEGGTIRMETKLYRNKIHQSSTVGCTKC